MSIRLRLTLWQTALLGLVLTVFAVVVYTAVARQETSQLTYTLRVRADDVEQALNDARRHDDDDGRFGHGPDEIDLSSSTVGHAISVALGDDSLFAQVIGPDGQPLARSENLAQSLAVPPAALRGMRGGDGLVKLSDGGGEAIQAYGRPLSLNRGGPPGVLVVASSLGPLAATLARWRLILALSVLGTTALSAAAGWFLASQAMRPVGRMTQAARAIGQTADLSERLPEPPQQDELGRLARTFNEMLSQLAAAFATQRRFLADAAHELRTPLTVVRTNVEALLRGAGADPAERDETLRAIARETDRMGRLVADLLVLARADAGQPLVRRRFDFDALVLEVYQQEQAIADGRRLELGEWEPVEVAGDPDRLKQVALNLVDNALRHTQPGGRVTLDLRRRGDEAVLRVRDTGPGIPPEHLDLIFERFYRVDQPRSRHAGGAGLGLAIAREVAAAHGGRIEVESVVGVGSTFSLVLPLWRPAPEPTRPSPGGPSAPGAVPAISGRVREVMRRGAIGGP